MTYLERTLATLSEAIAAAAAAGPSPLLASLRRRRDVICAALAAPEHAWHAGPAQAREASAEPRRGAPLPALADPQARR